MFCKVYTLQNVFLLVFIKKEWAFTRVFLLKIEIHTFVNPDLSFIFLLKVKE